MKKISVIFGTRPEAIKMAPIILALKEHPDFECHVCVTAQHREMLDQVLEIFEITPDVDLDLMQPNQSLAGLTGRAVTGLDKYLKKYRPDMVLVQGDTTTVLSGALAAFYNQIPVGHVEAGLRTGNLYSPWPEEGNRRLTSQLTAIHFAPTETSRQNLLKENIPDSKVVVTGNTVIDALFLALEKIKQAPPVVEGLPENLQPGTRNEALGIGDAPRLVLITGHRRENFGGGFENICNAIAELARRFPDVHFVYPMHLNPNVREPVERILGVRSEDGGQKPADSVNQSEVDPKRSADNFQKGNSDKGAVHQQATMNNIHLIEPLQYLPFVAMMNRAHIILTDSGGVQEEAPSLGKPVLVMRDTTERPEAVDAGTVKLVGTDYEVIVSSVSELLENKTAYAEMARAHNPYGDGKAAERHLKHM
ncbi:MAG: UDP-N-acetylglucosamine 2-epimerase (non-hydrolyzing) [Pontiella sp.]